MPLVQIKVLEGVFSPEQKRQMVNKVTDAMLSVEGENIRQLTTVIIEEVKTGDWAVGGTPLRTEDAIALAAGKLTRVA